MNALGEMVGVNSSIYSPSGGSIGLGFAIPIESREARDRGPARARHGAAAVDRAQARDCRRSRISARVDPLGGVVVGAVVPGSPADQAGIRAGDVLVRSRSRTIRNAFDWEAELLDLRVGDRVPLVDQARRRARSR